MVKRGPDGLSRAKRILDSARYYTFFTLDVSDILHYNALNETSAAKAEAYLDGHPADDELFKSVLAYHSQIDEALLGCLVAKYWNALEAAQALYDHILELKKDLPFDLELSIDENPPEVRTCQSLTQRYRTQIFDHRNPAAAAADYSYCSEFRSGKRSGLSLSRWIRGIRKRECGGNTRSRMNMASC